MLNGKCVATTQCPICVDESGRGRFSGEQWQYARDVCTTALCLPDGTVTQSQVTCASAPSCSDTEVCYIFIIE